MLHKVHQGARCTLGLSMYDPQNTGALVGHDGVRSVVQEAPHLVEQEGGVVGEDLQQRCTGVQRRSTEQQSQCLARSNTNCLGPLPEPEQRLSAAMRHVGDLSTAEHS
jgi:hypothetical protein